MKIDWNGQFLFCRSIIPALQESGNHVDAAKLIIDQQGDIEHGIQVLCEGHHYSAALYEAETYAEDLKGKFLINSKWLFKINILTEVPDILKLYNLYNPSKSIIIGFDTHIDNTVRQ